MYIRRLTDEYSATYILWLTNEYTILCSSVTGTFLSFGIEEYISVIFLSIGEYKQTEEDTLFSYSASINLYCSNYQQRF
jgi:hypothetical protein